ncbi:four helix bundle protein [Candidatus Shapirobacteria bacterium CG_4_10_14_0_8_um_filter_39_15]|nr:MAG: four helix bundle protein [Candidatus Shapirobacteria bacterium CG_4_10_14_0_8_um_filter_39_15]PJE68595.1 MAG: four helix bundle protein [Candidatus Shapirobacteria bacterium CG10_big_fil_rev_8_21_14_0_10_38_8]
MLLKDLKIYQKALIISNKSWEIYKNFTWQVKKTIGDQFIRAIDSIGANIAEGYGRFHYLDRIKFYYNARGSLLESLHWLELLKNRDLITEKDYSSISNLLEDLNFSLNAFIKSNYQTKGFESK